MKIAVLRKGRADSKQIWAAAHAQRPKKMDTTINIKFRWNSDEAVAAHLSHRMHSFRKSFRIAVNTIAILAMFAGIYRIVVFGWAFFPVTIFAGGFYWLFIRRYDLAWSVRRRFKKRPDKDKVVNWKITEKGLHSSVEDIGEAKLKWESFLKVVHVPNDFLFNPNNQIYNWFPHSAFHNKREIEKLEELAKEKVNQFINLV